MTKEVILVVNRSDLGDLPEKAFIFHDASLIRELSQFFRFTDRGPAETDPSMKQLIPYIVVFSHDGEVFVFRRLSGGGEKRLENLKSIGIGGHIRPSDGDDPIMGGALRELQEELVVDPLPDSFPLRFQGLLNDDTNPVGSVHLGLVFTLRLPAGTHVSVGEPDVLEGRFVRRAEVLNADGYETWSQIIVPHLEELWVRSS